MKKLILIFLTSLLTNTLFAQSKFEAIKKSIEKSNLVSFDKETYKKEQKPLVSLAMKPKVYFNGMIKKLHNSIYKYYCMSEVLNEKISFRYFISFNSK